MFWLVFEPSQVIAKVFLRDSSPKFKVWSCQWLTIVVFTNSELSQKSPHGTILNWVWDWNVSVPSKKYTFYTGHVVFWLHKWDSTTEISNLQNTWPPPPSLCFWIHDGDSGNCGPSGASLSRGLGGGSWFLGSFFTSHRISSSSRLDHLRHRLSSKSQAGKTSRIRRDLERDSRSSSNISHFPHVPLSGPPSCR